MPRVRKVHKIKKHTVHCSASQSEQQQSSQELHKDPALLQQQRLQESLLPDVPMKKSLKCDPREICNLSEEQRLKIKAQHPEMSQYFFMTQRDKTKYFHVVNFQYREQVKPSEPPCSAPKKKTIRFKKRFQIQHFKHNERCDQLRSRKSFMEIYVAIDKQKPKVLTRFPRVT